MTTELDRIAKKNTQQKLDAISKKQQIKKHNIKAASKAHSADPDREEGLFGYGLKSTKKSKSLHKEKRKVEKSEKWFDKQSDKLDEHGVWSKKNKKGSAIASLEKKDIIKKGFPSKAKMDMDVHRPNFPAKKLKGGGAALRGLGRAFLKGGRV